MALGTNMNLRQAMWSEKKLSTYIYAKLCHFEIFIRKSCLLYNFQTVKVIFINFGIRIKHHQTICTEKNITPLPFFAFITPFAFLLNSCLFYNYKTVKDIFILLTLSFVRMLPFCIVRIVISYKLCVRSISFKLYIQKSMYKNKSTNGCRDSSHVSAKSDICQVHT